MVLTLLVFKGLLCRHLLSTLREPVLPGQKTHLQIFRTQEGLSLVGV